ncbi:MAG TPA: trigger factor [Polyangiaceae bacterium]|nr:trigger factor [Polyangiaceae bacterium]
MQISVQRLSPVLVEFAVEVPADRVRVEVDKAYAELGRTAKIRGFRPGKAPREVLTHMFGSRVQADVAQRLVDSTLQQALARESVQPLTTLSISPNRLAAGEPFSYKARFEVSPDIEKVNYDGLAVKRPVSKVDDEVVGRELESLRSRHAELRAPDPARPAKAGDVLVIDFEVSIDGQPVPEASGKDVQTEVGVGRFLKELDEALLGASPGETREATVTFPADHVRPDFRNKAGLFRIAVKEVKERVLPELDDDFAKDVGSFQSLAELREDVAKKVEKRLQQEADDVVAERLVVALCEANPIPVPPSLVKRQAELTEQEIAEQAKREGTPFSMNDELRARVGLDAEIKVRAGLLMAAIAKEQQIKVTDQDVEQAYVELAEQTGKNVARLKAEYREARKREILLGMILEDKVLKVLQDKATLSDET